MAYDAIQCVNTKNNEVLDDAIYEAKKSDLSNKYPYTSILTPTRKLLYDCVIYIIFRVYN